MTAEVTRSTKICFVEETTENTYIAETAGGFNEMYTGFSFEPMSETLNSQALSSSIDQSKPLVNKQAGQGSFTRALKHSGVEGTAPEHKVLLESAFGIETVNSTEYDTISGSTAGTSTARGKVVVDSGEGANFAIGQALLIKEGIDSNSKNPVRSVYSISSDDLNLNFNTSSAASSGTELGKCVAYSMSVPETSFTAHLFQDDSGSAFHQAISGCRTTGITFDFPATNRATVAFNFEGLKFYHNPLTVGASNNKLNFNDGGPELTATLTNGTYQTPHALAREIQSKMDALTSDNITVSYSDSTGKFTIASDGTLNLLWKTGTNGSDNTDTHVGTLIGFSDAADDTGSASYAADNSLSFDPSVTPSYDSSDDVLVRDCELMIGSFADISCIKASNAQITMNLSKNDVLSFCASNGLDSSILTDRNVTFTASVIVSQYESSYFDKHLTNTGVQAQLTVGQKSAGNWTPGTVVSFWMPNILYTATPVAELNGYYVYNISGIAYEDGDYSPLYHNYL